MFAKKLLVIWNRRALESFVWSSTTLRWLPSFSACSLFGFLQAFLLFRIRSQLIRDVFVHYLPTVGGMLLSAILINFRRFWIIYLPSFTKSSTSFFLEALAELILSKIESMWALSSNCLCGFLLNFIWVTCLSSFDLDSSCLLCSTSLVSR